MSTETITEIPLADLHESPFNARKIFRGLDELAASIQAEGRIHQPLLVRPRRPHPLLPDVQEGYEIVFGHRRFRSAGQAGLATAPCMVREMSDAEARSTQTHENLQREDVHPIEEAEGFASMIEHDGLTADELAAVVGKSRSYVYERLKLLQAVPSIRAACLGGEIGAQVCLLIARLRTEKLQQKALDAIKGQGCTEDMRDGGQRSFRRIKELLHDRFMLDLAKALFSPEDATLVAAAGDCLSCPKRSGNAPEYGDIAQEEVGATWKQERRPVGPDVCTDPDCFEGKKKAHLKRTAAELEAKGKTVIDGAKARQAIGADGKVKGAYVALTDVRAALKKVSGPKPQVVTIQDPRGGKTVEAVKREDLVAAGVMKAAPAPAAKTHGIADDWKARQAERERQKQREIERALRLLHAIHARQGAPGLHEMRLVCHTLVEPYEYSGDREVLFQLWCAKDTDEITARIDSMDAAELTRLMLDCVLTRDCMDGPDDTLENHARHYGVDPEAVEAAHLAAQDAGSAPAKAAPAPEITKAGAGAGAKKSAKKAALAPVPGWPMPGSPAAAAKTNAKRKTGGKAAGEQTDDAGSAGGSGGQVDAFSEAEA